MLCLTTESFHISSAWFSFYCRKTEIKGWAFFGMFSVCCIGPCETSAAWKAHHTLTPNWGNWLKRRTNPASGWLCAACSPRWAEALLSALMDVFPAQNHFLPTALVRVRGRKMEWRRNANSNCSVCSHQPCFKDKTSTEFDPPTSHQKPPNQTANKRLRHLCTQYWRSTKINGCSDTTWTVSWWRLKSERMNEWRSEESRHVGRRTFGDFKMINQPVKCKQRI